MGAFTRGRDSSGSVDGFREHGNVGFVSGGQFD